jgi:iron complex outermembrane receptor protein
LTAASQAGAQEQKDNFQVETVIVTAMRNADDAPVVAAARNRLSRTPGAVAVVAAESYENRLVVGMPDLLRDVPGVIAEKRYGEESRLSIRGSGISQPYHQRGVLLAQDGVPFADADGFSDFQKIDALGARYIEVYKGGNALRFGGAQLGGAINLITPTGRTAEAPDMLRLEGGSFGTMRGRAAIARADDDWDVYGAIEGMTSDGFRDWSGQKEVRGTLNTGYSFGTD